MASPLPPAREEEAGLVVRKSTGACANCRARKVKCDEARPVCRRCVVRYVNITCCDYSQATSKRPRRRRRQGAAPLAPKSESPEESSSSSSNHPTPSGSEDEYAMVPARSPSVGATLAMVPSAASNDGPWRAFEMRLMHHYTSVVSQTMPDCSGKTGDALWGGRVPLLAFDCDMVLESIMALSAVHLHAVSPTDPALSLAVSRYVDRSLAKYKQAVASFDTDNKLAEQIYLVSIILSYVAWQLAHRRHEATEPYQVPTQAYRMTSGISTLFLRASKQLQGMGYDWFGNHRITQRIRRDGLSTEHYQAVVLVALEMEELLTRFDIDIKPKWEQAMYRDAAAYAVDLYRGYYSGVANADLLTFLATMPVRLPAAYLERLENGDPLVLAIRARAMVLTTLLDWTWWYHGQGEYEVLHREIQGMMDQMPDDCKWAMEWPYAVVKGEIQLPDARAFRSSYLKLGMYRQPITTEPEEAEDCCISN